MRSSTLLILFSFIPAFAFAQATKAPPAQAPGVAAPAAPAPAPAAPTPAPATDAKVTLKQLVERREWEAEKSTFSGWQSGIELTLHVDGASVAGARKYGKIVVAKATDDAGTDLAKSASKNAPGRDDAFQEIREPQSFGSMGRGSGRARPDAAKETKPTGFDFEVKLPSTSARGAKTLKLVSGTLQVLVGGEKKVVKVSPIAANLGKAVDDPALKSLGVTFTLVDPSQRTGAAKMFGGPADKSVSATIAGNIDAIASVSIVDASGKKLSNSAMWTDEPGARNVSYQLDAALPADAALQIEVWPGQKTLTVPFELKDVALP